MVLLWVSGLSSLRFLVLHAVSEVGSLSWQGSPVIGWPLPQLVFHVTCFDGEFLCPAEVSWLLSLHWGGFFSMDLGFSAFSVTLLQAGAGGRAWWRQALGRLCRSLASGYLVKQILSTSGEGLYI